ncbi:MAG TPA: hypothetical protein VJZ68_06940 [Nitrososphaera sp.]|nr:hypothetical protein [Nitrososphaera sp.]
MLAVCLLLLPVMAAFALLYGLWSRGAGVAEPRERDHDCKQLHTFQLETFSAAGGIGSLAGGPDDPMIITGRWSHDVQGATVAGFSTNLTLVNASGAGFCTIQLPNLSSTEVNLDANGTALITATLDVTINATEKLSGVDTAMSLAKLRALTMTLSELNYLGGPKYDTANQEEETMTASTGLMSEGSGISDNITEKFRLPQLPNPFK